MNVNVYLPDELGAQAKEAGLGFSALLRDAVTAELEQRQAVEGLRGLAKVHEMQIRDENDYPYDVRLHGTKLEFSAQNGAVAYLLEDGRLVVHSDADDQLNFYEEIGQEPGLAIGPDGEPIRDESGWLAQWFSQGEVVGIMSKLGKRAVVDIGMAS